LWNQLILLSLKPKGEAKATLPKESLQATLPYFWMCGFSLTLLSLKPKGLQPHFIIIKA